MTVEGVRRSHDRSAELARNRAFVAEINARTVCAHCGAQPIEWHNPEHVKQGKNHRRIARMVGKTFSIQAIQDEINRCTPLCRRCHMREDGRLQRFAEQARSRPKVKPPRLCTDCQELTTHPRRGLCKRCYDRVKRQEMSDSERAAFLLTRRTQYHVKTESGESLGAVKRRAHRLLSERAS